MAELDEREYRKLAAEHYAAVEDVFSRAFEIIPPESPLKLRFQNLLQRPEYHDALSVLGAITAMKEDDSIPPLIRDAVKRHEAAGKLQTLFCCLGVLPPDSPVAQEVDTLLRGFRRNFYPHVS